MPFWTTFRRDGAEPTAPGGWEEAPADALAALRPILETSDILALPEDAVARRTGLEFHPDCTLWELLPADWNRDSRPMYVAQVGDRAIRLDGRAGSLELLARLSPPRLAPDTVVDYVRFVLAFFREDGNGHFILLEDLRPVRWRCATTGFDRYLIEDAIVPPRIGYDDDGGFDLAITVLADDCLKYMHVRVGPQGRIRIPKIRLARARLPVVNDAVDDFPSDTAAFSLQAGWEPRRLSDLELPQGTTLPHWLSADQEGSDEPVVLVRPLSFLPDCLLARAWLPDDTSLGRYLLIGRRTLYPLNGDSTPIHDAREQERLVLDSAEAAIDYAIFFGLFTHGEQGPFRIVRVPSDLNVTHSPGGAETATDDRPLRWDQVTTGTLRRMIPLPEAGQEHGRWVVRALVHYGTDLFRAGFGITPDGLIEMLDDEPLLQDLPTDPTFDRFSDDAPSPPPPEADAERLELAVHRAWLRVLLLHALRRGDAAPLFRAGTEDAGPLLRSFAKFVFETCPAVIVQSELTYCERLLADLLAEAADVQPRKARIQTLQWEPGGAQVPELADGELLTLSFHTLHRFRRPEHLAHLLGRTHAPALFGCDSPRAVPAALRRVTDLVLDLGYSDPAVFRQLFCELFDCRWPEDVTLEGEAWPRHVLPSDFVRALRRKRRAGERNPWSIRLALDDIRRHALARFGSLQPRETIGLDDIHGMDEARAVARDLIDEIQLALAGELDWGELDRGFLLAGAPGTGKTMLARAIAAECGVRFIATSAAEWIRGTEHLGQHLEKIRAVFAEARRYAPSILFIDEIDSLGNRNNSGDPNSQYVAEVINAVLQEIQGFDTGKPVFVIAATNHVDNVDPALRRAGRLDQVIPVAHPNRAALAAILDFYLAPHRRAGRVAADIDLDELAGLAIGATGADIERFVRDAARRARKENEAIGARHLAAAITGQPRSLDAACERGTESLANTALHEAGHTVAMLLCAHWPVQPAFVSIVPDGRGALGFTAGSDDTDRRALTRAAYMEYLGVMLAGRAAEEIAFGPEQVTGGAGGDSENSDLARATRLLLAMEQRLGMGDQGGLRWHADIPGPEQRRVLSQRLRMAYEDIRDRLRQHWPLVEAVAERLRQDFQITGAELAALAARHGARPGAAKPRVGA